MLAEVEDELQVQVDFENGEEGIVLVTVDLPASYYSNANAFMSALDMNLTVSRGSNAFVGESAADDASFTLHIKESGSTADCSLGKDGKTVEVRYVLDSLKDGGSFASKALKAQNEQPAENGQQAQNALLAAADNDDANPVKVKSEDEFLLLPGENVCLSVDATFDDDGSSGIVILPGEYPGEVDPMFGILSSESGSGRSYTLTVSNGRNLQNLNLLAPSVAKKVGYVTLDSDINWNSTVTYYNKKYPSAEISRDNYREAPARALPYFVPISSESLFGVADFRYGDEFQTIGGGGLLNTIGQILGEIFDRLIGFISGGRVTLFSNNDKTPTLTDELDGWNGSNQATPDHASVNGYNATTGKAHTVSYLNINTNFYPVGNPVSGSYYAGAQTRTLKNGSESAEFTVDTNRDRFTGLFSYVNTTIRYVEIVNPSITGYNFKSTQRGYPNNPCTGALVGATGYHSLIENCGVYIDTADPGFSRAKMSQGDYAPAAQQDWYGVSGAGAVGGLIGYAKSHCSVTGDLYKAEGQLAFSQCFAAVNVTGVMQSVSNGAAYNLGYSNGVGGLVGNCQLTNFYGCYASGNVRCENTYVSNKTTLISDREDTVRDETGTAKLTYALFGDWGDFYSGKASYGGGGFTGTSHGCRYYNCFSTGSVRGSSATRGDAEGIGGFVGIMCYDENAAFGNIDGELLTLEDNKKINIKQYTVFSSCYCAGNAVSRSGKAENFCGANAYISKALYTFMNDRNCRYADPDYYNYLAPFLLCYKDIPDTFTADDEVPRFVFKDCYYLQGAAENGDVSSKTCAAPAQSDELRFLHLDGRNGIVDERINNIRNQTAVDVILPITAVSIYTDWLLGDYNNGNNTMGYKYGYDGFGLINNLSFLAGNTRSAFADYVYQTRGDLEYALPFNSFFYAYDCPVRTGSARNITKIDGSGQAMLGIYRSEFSKGFSKEKWCAGSDCVTHAYSPTNMGESYPYSMLQGMEYYGDWPVPELAAGVAYYEKYESGTYGFYYGDDDTSTLDNSAKVVDDGYAVLTKNSNKVSVLVNGVSYNLTKSGVSFQSSHPIFGNNLYSVWPITGENGVLDTDDLFGDGPVSQFFTAVDITAVDRVGSKTNTIYQTSYFNPALALTQRNYVSDTSSVSACPPELYVRTGRQLNEMSKDRFSAFWGEDANYMQMRGVDMSSYGNISIGSGITPFDGSYSGSGGYVDRAQITGLMTDDGLFGALGQNAYVSSLELVNPEYTGSGNPHAGILAAESEGVADNIALTFSGKNINVSATENAGILIGWCRNGSVSDCSVGPAEEGGAPVSATLTGNNVGFIGKVEGLDENEYGICALDIALDTVNFQSSCAGMAVGYASGSVFDSISVQANSVGGSASSCGGAFGILEDSSASNIEVRAGSCSSSGFDSFGGIAAQAVSLSGEGLYVNNSSVELGSVSASGSVGGAFGLINGFATDNISVISGPISGEKAAGFAVSHTGGSASLCSVDLSGTVYSSNSGAGFAVDAGSDLTNCTVTLRGVDFGGMGRYAAGFACNVSGNVRDCSVGGPAKVRAIDMAGGFAVSVANSADINHCIVSPADPPRGDYAAYFGNSNANLTVSAGTAGGFTAQNAGMIRNSNALGSVSGTAASAGFAALNSGVVQTSAANCDLDSSGMALVHSNEGTVLDCYAWFNGGTADSSGGDYRGSYFVPLGQTGKDVYAVVYKGDGTYVPGFSMGELTPSVLNIPGANPWSDPVLDAYPYNEIIPEEYCYPMLREHYGDWKPVPGYSFGAVYYEKLADDSYTLMLVDASNPAGTRMGSWYTLDTIAQGNDREIAETGYMLFAHSESQLMGYSELQEIDFADKLDLSGIALTDGTAVGAEDFLAEGYRFFVPSDGSPVDRVLSTGDCGLEILPFAKAIYREGADNHKYIIRTGEQFTNIALLSGEDNISRYEFTQERDIVLTDPETEGGTGSLGGFGSIYKGGSHKITLDGAASAFGAVDGAVVSSLTVNGTVKGENGESASLLADSIEDSTFTNVSVSADAVNDTALVAGTVVNSGFTTLTVSGKVESSVGGAGTSMGLAFNTVTDTTLSGVRVSGSVSSSAASVGGLAGTVGGDAAILNSEASCAVTSTGSGSVGGFVGFADGGEYTDCSATGKVTAPGAQGAVTADCPSGYGSVGKFVGHIEDGTFNTCSGTGSADQNYQFLGTVKATSETYNDVYTSSAPVETDVEASRKSTEEVYTTDDGVRFTYHGSVDFSTFTATLNNCTFKSSDGTHTQIIKSKNSDFYAKDSANEIHDDHYELVNAKSVSNNGTYYLSDGSNILTVVNTGTERRPSYSFGAIAIADQYASESDISAAKWQYTSRRWRNTDSGRYISLTDDSSFTSTKAVCSLSTSGTQNDLTESDGAYQLSHTWDFWFSSYTAYFNPSSPTSPSSSPVYLLIFTLDHVENYRAVFSPMSSQVCTFE